MATWVWWYMTMLMIILMWVMPTFSIEEVDNELFAYATIKYDLNTGKDGYSKFLTSFRTTVGPTKVCDIKTTSSTPNYIYVELQSSPTKTITVGLDTTDLYVWGYKDNAKYGGKTRARFFKEVPTDAYEKLFPGTDIKTKTKTSVNYDSMLSFSRFDRKNLDLRVTTLQEVFKEVYGKSESELVIVDPTMRQAEANFFFIMCQMIAETARFTFMEKLIISSGTKPESNELIAFQTNWNKAAKAIHATVPTCKDLNAAVQIGKSTYMTVAALREKIALIKFEKKVSLSDTLLESAVI
ncbi:unnamed protein product [Amaranthus hypochondriacus]